MKDTKFLKLLNKPSKELIGEIIKMKKNEVFEKYINYIYFPFFKNFKLFSQIDFSFPLTVIVGKNGSGKSSLLHALYGCPEGKSIGKYWFSTATDPIKDGDGKDKRHCFVYSYNDGENKNIKVLKMRASRPGTAAKRMDPDYWETSRPVKKYKMENAKRYPPIVEDVIYLDFREELSAFDKFFYFGDLNNLRVRRKQDFIREVAPQLNSALKTGRIYKAKGSKTRNKKVESLTKQELKIASYILGVKYTEGKIIYHNFYRNWGYTAYLTKSGNRYTEAHAGSGEYAVIKLVHTLHALEDGCSSLILLDEPETSLYPGAQKRLLNYLLSEIIRTKSQMVIATHSEKFISDLPENAIKSIHCNEETGESIVKNNCLPSTVFSELEVPLQNKIKIIVEDEAAKLLVESVIKSEDIKGIEVLHINCGANYLKGSSILEDAMQENKNKYYILDGDQKIEVSNPQRFAQDEANDIKFIDEEVNKIQTKIPFPTSKSRENADLRKDKIRLESEKKYLEFFYHNVTFLPQNTPEDIVYNFKVEQKLSSLAGVTAKEDLQHDSKEKIHNVAKILDNEKDYSIYKIFVKKWLVSKNDDYNKLRDILNKIAENKSLR